MNPYVDQIYIRYQAMDEGFRGRPTRERAILAGGILAVAFMCIDSLAIRPVTEQIDRFELATERTEAELASLEEQSQSLSGRELSNEEKRLIERKNLLQAQLREVDSKIRSEISELVPPRAIVSVLEELLAPISSLHLVSLQSQVPLRLGSDPEKDPGAEKLEMTGGLYRHGVRIEIEGDFAATLEFLERAEASTWNLFWDRLEYRVSEFPTATITVDLHTISDQEDWIGV